MCSLEHNKNAGNSVVRRDDGTRPSFRREQINCPGEQWPGEAYENIDVHEVECEMTRGWRAGSSYNTGKKDKDKSKEANVC